MSRTTPAPKTEKTPVLHICSKCGKSGYTLSKSLPKGWGMTSVNGWELEICNKHAK